MSFLDAARTDIKDALSKFPDLSPKAQMHVFPDRTRRNALTLAGTIPISYRGARYHIPIALYLMENHPYSPPYCYVCPTSNMKIRVSERVDDTGRIFLPYLNEWRYPGSDTYGLLQVLTFAFEEICPVFSVKPGTASTNKPNDSSIPGKTRNFTLPHSSGSTTTPYPVAQPSGFPMPVPNQSPYPSVPMPNAMSTDPGGYRAPYPVYPPARMPTPFDTAPPVPVPPRHSSYDYAKQVRNSLLTAIEEKLNKRIREKYGFMIEDNQRLDICLNEMRTGQKQLRDSLERAEREQREIELMLSVYNGRKRELTEALKAGEGTDDEIDSSIDAFTPLHRQIFDNYAKDLTMDDVIYHLTVAMRKKVISLQQYLTLVRQCARSKFFAIVTMNKAREVAGLPPVTQM